jgi:ferredoxin
MVFNDKNVEGMCNCCSDCCGVIGGLRAFGPGRTQGHVSNYMVRRDDELCTECGVCAERCTTRAQRMKEDKLVFDATRCVGCGLCVDTCSDKALKLHRLPEEQLNYPPNDSYTELLDEVAANRRKTHLI